MSKRDWRILVDDIISSVNKIENYVTGLTFEEFDQNSMIIDAVVRNLEIIGEAATKIPDEIQVENTQVPWKKLKGIRNRIIHEYFAIDTSIIWFIAQNEIHQLRENLNKINPHDRPE